MPLSLRLRQIAVITALTVLPEICHASTGAALLANFIQNRIIAQALVAFWGIAAAAIFYYAFRMVVDAYEDKAFSDMSQSVLYALIGFAVIGSAVSFANSFTSNTFSAGPIPTISPNLYLAPQLSNIRIAMRTLSYFIFFLMIVISGFRMMFTRGEQGEFDKWRKVIVGSCVGAIILFIADALVAGVSGANPLPIIIEVKGLILFLLTFSAFVCGAAIIVAGIFLIVSLDEALKERAKKAIIGSLLALAIILASYAIIVALVPENTFR